MANVILTLSPEQYETLTKELHSLHGYHWNDDRIHADNCGSKIVEEIESQKREQESK
jgi:hypothetical protein